MRKMNWIFVSGFLLGIVLTIIVSIGLDLRALFNSRNINQCDTSFDQNFDLNHSEIK